MRPPISEALADDARQGGNGTVGIAAAERGAVVVAELIFRQIAVQVPFGAVLVDALHAALEDREGALHGVRVDRAVVRVHIDAALEEADAHQG